MMTGTKRAKRESDTSRVLFIFFLGVLSAILTVLQYHHFLYNSQRHFNSKNESDFQQESVRPPQHTLNNSTMTPPDSSNVKQYLLEPPQTMQHQQKSENNESENGQLGDSNLPQSEDLHQEATVNFNDTEQTSNRPTDMPSSHPLHSTFFDYPTAKLIKPGEHINVPKPESRIGPQGEPGYLHDPSFLHKSPHPFQIRNTTLTCVPVEKGWETPRGAPELMKIRKHIQENQATRKNVSLFCSIYTYAGGENWTEAISET